MTTARPVVVVGVGGFGRETADVLRAADDAKPSIDVLGFLDDSPSVVNLRRIARRGISYLGSIDAFLADPADVDYVVGIGAPAVRRTAPS